MEKQKSEVNQFIKKFDRFYEPLHKEGKITTPTREAFLREYLCLGTGTERNFYTQGIRRIYRVILELLERVYPSKKEKL